MVKKTLMFIILLFVVGCQANYNLTINDDSVIESGDFLLEKSEDNKKILDQYYKTKYLAFYDMNNLKDYDYEKKKIDNGKYIGMNLSFIYRGTNYQKSSMLDRCFYKKSFMKTDKYIILYTDGGASCFYKDETKLLDSLNVNIKTDFIVAENNADKVEGNTYTWIFTNENFSKKDIMFKVKREKKFNSMPIIVIVLLLLIVILVLIRVKRINSKSNKL